MTSCHRYPEEYRFDAIERKLNYWRKREAEVSKEKYGTARGEVEVRFVKRFIAETILKLERKMSTTGVTA